MGLKMQSQPPTVVQFLRLMFSSWASGCSGALSVPFAAYAAYTSTPSTSTAFTLLAILSFGFAAYSVWAKESRLKIAIEQQYESLLGTRQRPELYIRYQSMRQATEEEGFYIENKGTTALNVNYSLVGDKALGIQFIAMEKIDAGVTRRMFFKRWQEQRIVPLGNSPELTINALCEAAQGEHVTEQLSIEYQDGAGIRYRTNYELTFSYFSHSCDCRFVEQSIVDKLLIPREDKQPFTI
jgi:hypothetical protein